MHEMQKIFTLEPGEKILALDLGDQWVGSALSDGTQTLAKPLHTSANDELENFLHTLFQEQPIKIVVVGHPRTMKGTISEQTLTAEKTFSHLQNTFRHVHWILWDERLSSKRASQQRSQKTPSKNERIKAHSIAAAYILDSYLTFLKAQHSSL